MVLLELLSETVTKTLKSVSFIQTTLILQKKRQGWAVLSWFGGGAYFHPGDDKRNKMHDISFSETVLNMIMFKGPVLNLNDLHHALLLSIYTGAKPFLKGSINLNRVILV